MKYRNQGITPDFNLTIQMKKWEKKQLQKIQNDLMKETGSFISIAEMARRAIHSKIRKLKIKQKRVRKEKTRDVRIALTATKELYRDIKIATQETNESSVSDFMRKAIFEYYGIKK